MGRRKFIADSLKLMSGIILFPSMFVSCSKDRIVLHDKKKVLVIGAGISGLAVAQELTKHGYPVTIIEAQNKVGGRIQTNRSLGTHFDEGASWIHKAIGNPISNLTTPSGAHTYFTDLNNMNIFNSNGTAYDNSTIITAENDYRNALRAVKQSGTRRQSFKTVFDTIYPNLGNNPMWKYMLSAYLEFDTGGDIADLSSKFFYDGSEFSGDDVIISNGYDHIANYMSQGLDVRLNTRVTSINYEEKEVSIGTDNGNFTSDIVVVTVPLGVLKNNSIRFTPSLPTNKQNAIAGTQMGVVNKFFLTWDTAFWDSNLQFIGYTPDTKGKFNFFLNINKFTNTNGLVSYAFGDYAKLTETMTDSQIIDEIMLHLKSIYGNSIPHPNAFLRTKWGQNINSFGSYSFVTNGRTSNDFNVLSDAVNNKLFFAGEHTNKEFRSSVHGAYLSGIREANRIISLQ